MVDVALWLRAGEEPGADGVGAEVDVHEGGEIDPEELDGIFAAGDGRRGVRIGAGLDGGMFHVEHDGPFVAGPGALLEGVFAYEQGGAGADVEACFLVEFADEGIAGGLGEVDVAAGEVGVGVFFVAAEEDVGAPDQQSTGNELDGGVL